MRFRLAKLCDLNEIVNIHYAVRESQALGVFSQLGRPFLREFYSIILADKNEIVVCGEDQHGVIQGFCSATLDAEKQFSNLRKHRFSLGISALGSIICKPALISSLISRYRSIQYPQISRYVTTKGARNDYWIWSPLNKDSISAVALYETTLSILRDLGVKELNLEVDLKNASVFRFHKINGAELIETIILPDSRERAFMRYNLAQRKPKLRIV
jgi:hypothetical protein